VPAARAPRRPSAPPGATSSTRTSESASSSNLELLRSEFDRQVENLIRKGYPELAGLEERVFLQRVAPLRQRLPGLAEGDGEARIAFVIVISGELVSPDEAMVGVELDGKRGFTRIAADDLSGFTPLEGLELPAGSAYLVADVDTGGATLNAAPAEAIRSITRENRSPLTIDEGIALITHYPEVLGTRNCFSILGSRCGDRRVTAMWISGGSPRLGWCWAGSRHAWLGSASCGKRVGADCPAS
jgi:hypothetical protein